MDKPRNGSELVGRLGHDHGVTQPLRALALTAVAAFSITACGTADSTKPADTGKASATTASAATSTTMSELASKHGQAGHRLVDIGDTVTVAVDNKYGGTARVTVSDLAPISGGMVKVTVKIEGVRGAPHYNALDFDARTTDGRVLERTYDGGATTLEYGEVLEGEFVVGDIAYPAVGDIASITYTPNFKRKATWQVRP